MGIQHNNQSRVDNSGRLDVGCAGQGACGETLSRHLGVEQSDAKITQIQYLVACIGHQLADQNTTTNQKQAVMAEGSMEGICDKQDTWGKRNTIILGRCKFDRG